MIKTGRSSKYASVTTQWKEFIKGIIFTLIVIALIKIFTDIGENSFTLSFEFVDVKPKTISVNFDNYQLQFSKLSFESLDTMGNTLEFLTPNKHGYFDLEIQTENGDILSQNNIEYKSGKYNYITIVNGKVVNVKGHWE
ncbi:hypothetical protein N7931_09460 [Catenovulum sp. 2E275]|uniref:hypothetical protein n=1 Tax=Catenovulum sp. 2E275 TaxID=2980497 RepID=UPI0021CDF595|nr:hypothetical protein [Catenovulum sp. 2E275]MCU4675861.1 hypothetical protein [Catenovulum sp. 2E275]